MNWIPLIAVAAAGTYVYKRKPQWIPKAIRPKSLDRKIASLQVVSAASAPTPSHLVGLDDGMTQAQIAAANGLLASGTDSAAMYAMASQYSELHFVKTAEALIRKADAIELARKHGADDAELIDQMNTAASSAEWEKRFGSASNIQVPSWRK